MSRLRIVLVCALALALCAAACSGSEPDKTDQAEGSKTSTMSTATASATESPRPQPSGPAATIRLSNLTSGYVESSALVTTESIDPPANTLLLAHLMAFQGGRMPEPPTLSGNNVTWTLVGGNLDGEKRHWVFRGLASDPTAGPVTIDWGGIDTRTLWVIDAAEGADTGNDGADGIVQFVSQESQQNAAEGAIELQPFSDPDHNATVCFALAGSGAATGIDPTDGFVETGEAASKGQNLIIDNFWKVGESTTCPADFVDSSGTKQVESWLFLAIELQAARA